VLIGSAAVAHQILHWAHVHHADVIVLGTQGLSGLRRWMLGSVAHQIVQVAPCPVLSVGPEGMTDVFLPSRSKPVRGHGRRHPRS
jgi:nucleotide-binding universal stress UspA family protein